MIDRPCRSELGIASWLLLIVALLTALNLAASPASGTVRLPAPQPVVALAAHPADQTAKGHRPALHACASGDDLGIGARTREGVQSELTGSYDPSDHVTHTYYVIAGQTPVLVHNTGPNECVPGAMGLGPRYGTAVPSVSDVHALVPQGQTLNTWGQQIWGVGAGGAESLIGTRSAAQLAQISGLNPESAVLLREFYRGAAEAGKGGATAPARVRLLDDVIRTLRSGG